MKILFDGTQKIERCKNCKTIFMYDENDIEADDEFDYILSVFVKCPKCGIQIEV